MEYKEIGRKLLYVVFDPFVRLFAKLGVTPNHVTMMGFMLNVGAALYLVLYLSSDHLPFGEQLVGFGFILGFAGLMDSMDGRLARLYELHSSFGAYYDSVVDRYSEFIMFIAMVLYFSHFDKFVGMIAVLFAMMGSLMVSYNRSRAESLGVDCNVGLMQRPERIVFIGLWSIGCGIFYHMSPHTFDQFTFLHQDIYTLGLIWLAVSTNITAVRRIIFTRNRLIRGAE